MKLAEARSFAKSLKDNDHNGGWDNDHDHHHDDNDDDNEGLPSVGLIGMVEKCMEALLPINEEVNGNPLQSRGSTKSKAFNCRSLLYSVRGITSPLHPLR